MASVPDLFINLYNEFINSTDPDDDDLKYEKIRSRFGGRVRAIISSSPFDSPKVCEFLSVCFQCKVYELYGQTETSAFSCLKVDDFFIPAPCCEIKLVSIPSFGYFGNDPVNPRGQICVRGPNCYTGYKSTIGYYDDGYNVPELIDFKGWVHTSEFGEWDQQGRLKIIQINKHPF